MKDFPNIREVYSPISKEMLRPLDGQYKMVQFKDSLSDGDFQKLALFMKSYPSVTLRRYGYDRLNNLDFLRYFPFIVNFQCDVYDLGNIDGLSYLPKTMESLILGCTKQKFSLSTLDHFESIGELYLEGHKKDIEVITKFGDLEKLTLRSITLPDLSVLKPLRKLWWLAIKLGATNNLQLLPQIGNIKYLELWMIKGLTDISAIGDLEMLQYLVLQSLKNICTLPSFDKLQYLRRIILEDMKGVKDISPLMGASSLEEALFIGFNQMNPEDFSCLSQHPSLRWLSAGFGSIKKNNILKEIIQLSSAGELNRFDFS